MQMFSARMLELCNAPDIEVALRIANDILEASHQASIVIFGFDGRRKTLVKLSGNAANKVSTLTGSEEVVLALDQLPVAVRDGLIRGDELLDIGIQSAQYAEVFRLPIIGGDCRLLLKGILMDRSLTAIIVSYGERLNTLGSSLAEQRRFESVNILANILSVLYLRFAERSARFEAVANLESLTHKLHGTHERRIKGLESELIRLQDERGEVIDHKRAEQLTVAAVNAKRRAATAEARLETLEEQIGKAVERLEHAHEEISNLEGLVAAQTKQIRELEAKLGAPTKEGPFTRR